MLRVNILTAGKRIIVDAIYRSPNSSCTEFIRDLSQFFETQNIQKGIDAHFFMRDINIDILKENENSGKYLNILYENGFSSIINGYSRVTTQTKSCLDHIFAKSKIPIHSSLTGHDLTFVELKIGKNVQIQLNNTLITMKCLKSCLRKHGKEFIKI
ncbi:hypothetical protein HHI36_019043 [Cryptolaemus montrouzieri]|uniref:Uncharacterized protein n=1 Tax=Cryptolaemus montrouzieri TaxID=559131 RepID=A0ABD2P297_9CUCU